MKKKDEVITFSIDQDNIIYSSDARKHNRRLVSNYLKALNITYSIGKCGEADDWENEIFIVPASHEEAIKNLVKVFKQEFYCVSRATKYSNLREVAKMDADTGKELEVQEVTKVRKEDVRGLLSWFYDSIGKQYWAVTKASTERNFKQVG